MNILLTSMPIKPTTSLQMKNSPARKKTGKAKAEDSLEIDGNKVRTVRLSVQPHLGANVDILAY